MISSKGTTDLGIAWVELARLLGCPAAADFMGPLA